MDEKERMRLAAASAMDEVRRHGVIPEKTKWQIFKEAFREALTEDVPRYASGAVASINESASFGAIPAIQEALPPWLGGVPEGTYSNAMAAAPLAAMTAGFVAPNPLGKVGQVAKTATKGIINAARLAGKISEARQPSREMLEAYRVGQALRAKKDPRAIERWVYETYDDVPFKTEFVEDPVLNNFMDAGLHGSDVPSWRRGWRHGNIPEGGRSFNHADNSHEYGVSMMAVDGDKAKPDGTFEMFNPGRKAQWAEGWTVTHKRGSDGEPMLVGAVPVDPLAMQKDAKRITKK